MIHKSEVIIHHHREAWAGLPPLPSSHSQHLGRIYPLSLIMSSFRTRFRSKKDALVQCAEKARSEVVGIQPIHFVASFSTCTESSPELILCSTTTSCTVNRPESRHNLLQLSVTGLCFCIFALRFTKLSFCTIQVSVARYRHHVFETTTTA